MENKEDTLSMAISMHRTITNAIEQLKQIEKKTFLIVWNLSCRYNNTEPVADCAKSKFLPIY